MQMRLCRHGNQCLRLRQITSLYKTISYGKVFSFLKMSLLNDTNNNQLILVCEIILVAFGIIFKQGSWQYCLIKYLDFFLQNCYPIYTYITTVQRKLSLFVFTDLIKVVMLNGGWLRNISVANLGQDQEDPAMNGKTNFILSTFFFSS